MERLEGYGEAIVTQFGLQKGDVLIIHSVSGRNNVTIDMAIKARKLGVKVISLTNLEYPPGSCPGISPASGCLKCPIWFLTIAAAWGMQL